MPSRIDDKTLVPLGIVVAFFSLGFSIAATGAFWVKSVNDRLSRIEDKLGIAKAPPHPGMLPVAEAGERSR